MSSSNKLTQRFIYYPTLFIYIKNNLQLKMVIPDNQKIYYKKCKDCGKEIISLSEQQCNFNYKVHCDTCKVKKENETTIN